jgi:hypothetical protein
LTSGNAKHAAQAGGAGEDPHAQALRRARGGGRGCGWGARRRDRGGVEVEVVRARTARHATRGGKASDA